VKPLQGLMAAALLAGPMVTGVTGAGPVTYRFTGSVYADITGGGLQPPIGSLVTGTYVFDLADGVASQSRLPISTTSEWFVLEGSGPLLGIPTLNPDYVFSDTVHIGGISYQTSSAPGPYQSESYVEGIPGATGTWIVGGQSGGNVYVAEEFQISSADGHNNTESFLILDNPNHDPWSSVGLPVFADGTLAQGLFVTTVNGVESGVIYNLTSLHPVPEPATLALLALGVMGLGVASLRRVVYRF
jgi:PEP-CTERM motif-containing protein